MAPDPNPRTGTRTRRRSACHRHPNEPVVGLCALCLRDRLAGLDTSTDQVQVKNETIVSFPLSRRTRGYAGVGPELRRSKSVAVEKCEIVNDLSLDLRRKSCDVRASNRLTDLFDIDDTKTGGDGVTVESKNLGISSIVEPVVEINEDHDDCSEVRVSNDRSVRNEIDDNGEIGEDEGLEEDLKTMKEHIEMELQNRKKNFWEAASVFSQKLRKWRQKHKEKKRSEIHDGESGNTRSNFGRFNDSQIQPDVVDYRLGRRSCDTAPRFSVDAHCMSVDDPQCSYDEPRASWDGYMIARTIPRLTPMLPIVDDMIFPPVNKRITVKEDGSSSGASAKSNSDSSSSITASSSSSSSKTAGLEGNYMKSVSQRNDVIGSETKLVITERELNNWPLRSVNDSNLESTLNAPVSARRTVKNGWSKVSNLWSYKSKHSDKKNGSYIYENGPSLNPNNENNGVARGNSSGKLVRNSSCVGSRIRTESHPNGQEGARHSISDIESGLLRLHFSSFAKSKKLAPSMATDV